MPSYAELQAEPWWSREVVTDELDRLGDELCRRTARPRDAFGTKGNNLHLNGGHRSQEWILNSDWCTNTSYTVQSGLTSDQLRHIGAADFTPGAWGTAANRALVAAQTKRLWDAAKAGRLVGLRQILGTLDGRNAIGLNVVSGSLAYPDSSHLDHWHLTFDRRYLRDAGLMSRILETVIGDDMDTAVTWNTGWMAQRVLLEDADTIVIPANSTLGASGYQGPNHLKRRLVALAAAAAADETRDAAVLAAVQALANAGGVDAAPIVAAIKSEASTTRDLVEQRHAAEMSELSRIHATQLAEKEAELAGLRAELDRLTGTQGG